METGSKAFRPSVKARYTPGSAHNFAQLATTWACESSLLS